MRNQIIITMIYFIFLTVSISCYRPVDLSYLKEEEQEVVFTHVPIIQNVSIHSLSLWESNAHPMVARGKS